MCKLFRRKRTEYEDPAELRFDAMMDLVKDLSRPDYNRLKKAMDLGYQSYQTVRNVKTDDEKEVSDINEVERSLQSKMME
jgi:hypothetical protein